MKTKTKKQSAIRHSGRQAKKPKMKAKKASKPKKRKIRTVSTATDHSFIFAKGKQKKQTAKDSRDLANAKANTRSKKNLREHRSTDPTQIYLRELGYQTLLTAKEELQVARRIPKSHKKNPKHII